MLILYKFFFFEKCFLFVFIVFVIGFKFFVNKEYFRYVFIFIKLLFKRRNLIKIF